MCLQQSPQLLTVSNFPASSKYVNPLNNLDSFISNEDISYNFVYIGEFEINGDTAMKEFSKLIKRSEDVLLSNINNFEDTCYKLKKKALKIAK